MTDRTPLWPNNHTPQSLPLFRQPSVDVSATLSAPEAWLAQYQDVWVHVAAWVADQKQPGSTPIIGIHGGQGSGKSTLSQALADIYRQVFQWNTVIVSIDDLYLSHQERQVLSQSQHPLLATRGVPGTHDVILGQKLFRQLQQLAPGETLSMPRFDKVSDDRLPPDQWHTITGPVDLILFEGWCVGCKPVPESQLETPINALETTEDADQRWRQSVNQALAHDYHHWFEQIDRLIMLKVPDMQAVFQWRRRQEQENRNNTQGQSNRSMNDAALQRFIQHYERLTLHALQALPNQADLVLELNPQHAVSRITLPT